MNTKQWWLKRITHRTVVSGAVVFVCLLTIYSVIRFRGEIFTVSIPFLLALLLSYLLNPLVKRLEQRRIPRSLSIMIVYIIFLCAVLVFSLRFIPTLLEDLQELAVRLPEYMETINSFFTRLQTDYRRIDIPPGVREVIDESVQGLQDSLANQLDRVNEYIVAIFNRILVMVLIPVLAYYILLDENNLKNQFTRMIPNRFRCRVLMMFAELDESLGAYLRSMVIISVMVGMMTYLGLLFLGVDFALFLGLLNGLTNLIPFIGPLIGFIPVALIALLDSPSLALRVLILIFIIQQVENQLLAPQILGRSLGFHPLFVIFVLLLSGHVAGLLGLVFALPLATAIKVFIKHLFQVVERYLT